MTKTYTIKTGYWVSYYKEVEFTVESDKKPEVLDEYSLLSLWQDRKDVLRIDTDETSESFDWADIEKLEIKELEDD